MCMLEVKEKNKRFEVLDSFRGIAAIVVAIFHYTKENGNIGQSLFISNGYRFVEFFFVLSGFIIYLNYEKISKVPEQISFLKKRIFRLYPLHLFMLILFILFEILKAVLYKYGVFNTKAFTTNTPLAIIPNLLLTQGIVNSSRDFTWNYPSWSISVEMINYLFFVLIIPFLGRLNRIIKPLSLLLISLLALAISYLNVKPFEMVIKCIYCFFLGAFILIIYRKYLKNIKLSTLGINLLELLMMIIMVSCICFLPQTYSNFLPWLYAMVILVFSFEEGFISTALKSKFFLMLGTLSYSIYMTHAMVANILKVVMVNILKLSPALYDVTIILFLTVVLVFSYWTYNNIEMKAQNFLRKTTLKEISLKIK